MDVGNKVMLREHRSIPSVSIRGPRIFYCENGLSDLVETNLDYDSNVLNTRGEVLIFFDLLSFRRKMIAIFVKCDDLVVDFGSGPKRLARGEITWKVKEIGPLIFLKIADDDESTLFMVWSGFLRKALSDGQDDGSYRHPIAQVFERLSDANYVFLYKERLKIGLGNY